MSATTASPRTRGAGVALALVGSVSNQAGAAIGATVFPAIGVVGVVAIRQFVTAIVLIPLVRPKLRSLGPRQWWPVVGLAVVFSVMNLGLYAAVDRIGLGLAVTLEFLGPLAVTVASSRGARDIGCAALAGIGVVVLTHPGPSTDFVGVGLALLAAAAWAAYILLNRTVGRRLPGLHGTAIASLLSAAAWTPIAIVWFTLHAPSLTAIGLAAACGLMASVVPYVADLQALRRVPAQLFGILTSLNPVWAALAGLIVLNQSLETSEWLGIVLIVGANVGISTRTFSLSRRRRGARTP